MGVSDSLKLRVNWLLTKLCPVFACVSACNAVVRHQTVAMIRVNGSTRSCFIIGGNK